MRVIVFVVVDEGAPMVEMVDLAAGQVDLETEPVVMNVDVMEIVHHCVVVISVRGDGSSGRHAGGLS